MNIRKIVPVLAGGVAIALATLAAGGCSNDSNSTDTTAAAIAGITFLDAQSFHAFKTELTDEGTVPATAASVARKSQAVLELTDWPEAVKDDAKQLAELMDTMADELEKDTVDIEAAKTATSNAHNAWHEFSHLVWDTLQGEAGITGGEDGHDDHGS